MINEQEIVKQFAKLTPQLEGHQVIAMGHSKYHFFAIRGNIPYSATAVIENVKDVDAEVLSAALSVLTQLRDEQGEKE